MVRRFMASRAWAKLIPRDDMANRKTIRYVTSGRALFDRKHLRELLKRMKAAQEKAALTREAAHELEIKRPI